MESTPMDNRISNATGPIIRTQSGDIRGQTSNDIHVFKGIPFAASPFGPNHLRPPQPVKPWGGVRDALAFGPKCPQAPYPPGVGEALAEVVGSGEDCLKLNIWTPSIGAPAATGRGMPVLVWIPGGMFEFHATGGSAYYDGSRFARDGVVCVTISYRVGLEGFLYLVGDGTANLGLLDQIAALEWVRDNVAAFGGDPSRVTLFGESAGGMSVATLLAVPRARGLFRRAIVQSGNAPRLNTAGTAARIGQRMAEMLGVEATRDALASVPYEQILEAQGKLRMQLQTQPDPTIWGEVALTFLPWAPTIDGDVIPDHPVNLVGAGSASDVDLLVGSNTEETRLFFLSDGSIDRMTEDTVSAMAGAYGLSPQGLEAYRKSHPGFSAGELLSAIQTDWFWRIPAQHFADAHSNAASDGAGTYMYEFAWRSPQMGGRLGAAHTVEIPFVFDTLGFGTEPLLGPMPPQGLADMMHRAWVSFAVSGQPAWPRYEVEQRHTMHFDDNVSIVVENPLQNELNNWTKLSDP